MPRFCERKCLLFISNFPIGNYISDVKHFFQFFHFTPDLQSCVTNGTIRNSFPHASTDKMPLFKVEFYAIGLTNWIEQDKNIRFYGRISKENVTFVFVTDYKWSITMGNIQLNISKQQFVGLIQSMSEKDRLEIFDRLRKSLFVSRFNRLLKSTRTDELSLEDITREVEAVRQAHYDEQKQ